MNRYDIALCKPPPVSNEKKEHVETLTRDLNNRLDNGYDLASAASLDAMAGIYGLTRQIESDEDLQRRLLQTISPPTPDDLEQRTISNLQNSRAQLRGFRIPEDELPRTQHFDEILVPGYPAHRDRQMRIEPVCFQMTIPPEQLYNGQVQHNVLDEYVNHCRRQLLGSLHQHISIEVDDNHINMTKNVRCTIYVGVRS